MTAFYLAGKISKNGWRHSIVDGLREVHPYSDAFFWPTLKAAIFEQFDYTGPHFSRCDHGCTHRAGEHTWFLGPEGWGQCPEIPPFCEYRERGGHGTKLIPDCNENCDNCVATPSLFDPHSANKTWVTTECERAITFADIVFAWLDSDDAYGTLVELGIASARGKQIWIATPQLKPELWFAYNLAQRVERHSTAYDALWSMTEPLREANIHDNLIESPIEEMFWKVAKNKIPNLVPQVEIGPYRADFAFTDRKVLVELDGHDYHKTKDQRTKDARRDRYLQENGWQVIRFTGSEIYRDTGACVEQVLRMARNI